MKLFIIISTIVIITCLTAENILAIRHRCALKHVIHVNGTRGKSSVTRLIAAALSEAGFKVYCKTTGTLPMTIDVSGNETEIKRIGMSNISEQIKTLGKAYKDGADILVIECMAVNPELQYVCEHKILKSDIGVITNARIDHVAEMGDNLYDVTNALSNTIPKSRLLFTADCDNFEQFKKGADKLSTKAYLCDENSCDDETVKAEVLADYMFPDNIFLALSVCKQLGVDYETALRGMKKVKADPFEVSLHTLPCGVHFLDGMSANDPISTNIILNKFIDYKTENRKTVFVLNTRSDRGYRTNLMIDFVKNHKPDEVWLLGGGSRVAARKLQSEGLTVKIFKTADDIPIKNNDIYLPTGSLIYAIGNIANEGFKLIDIVREEEKKCTEK